MDMSLSNLWEIVKDREACCPAVHEGHKELDTTKWLNNSNHGTYTFYVYTVLYMFNERNRRIWCSPLQEVLLSFGGASTFSQSHVESLPVLAQNLPLYTHHGHLLHVGGHWAKIWALFLDKNRMEGRDKDHWKCLSVQFSSVVQSCPTLCDPVNHSTPGLPVHHQLLEFTQTHAHWVSDAIQPSHPLSSPSPPAPNPSQHQSLFQWIKSSHEVAKVLEL